MSATAKASARRVLVVVPTYNEVDNARPLAERLLALPNQLDVLYVDDNSPDGTGNVADEIAAAEPRFHVIHRTENRGYAPSSRAGLTWGLEQGFDTVCTMDGDLSHDPEALPGMLERVVAGAGLVIGSRYTDGGGLQVDWSPMRRAVSELGSAYARLMVGTPVKDCTSGYRCYSADTLRQIDFEGLFSDGYSFLIEMLAAVAKTGARVEEFPIVYVDRRHGESKISRGIILEALMETTRLGIRRAAGR
jgi:dolichol-phosphate mannosyltransferase